MRDCSGFSILLLRMALLRGSVGWVSLSDFELRDEKSLANISMCLSFHCRKLNQSTRSFNGGKVGLR